MKPTLVLCVLALPINIKHDYCFGNCLLHWVVSDAGHTSGLSYMQNVQLIMPLCMEDLSHRKPESDATFLNSFGVKRHQ